MFTTISADSHVTEPHDLWQQRVSEAFRDRAPRLVHEDETDRLVCDGAELPPVGLLAGCARGDDEVRLEGRWDVDVFRSGYDPTARLASIEKDGVYAEVLYPTIAMQLYPLEDQLFQWELFRAYNTWLAEDFCGAYPDRYKGIAMLSTEDLDAAVREVQRARDIGLSGVMIPMIPGDNPYHSVAYDPLWAAAVDFEMPVHMHTATTRDRSRAWNKGTMTDRVLRPVHVERIFLDMIFTGVFDRFPALKVVSAELDAGWAGNMLERADFNHRRQRVMAETQCEEQPSTYFRRNIRVTFMRDRTAILAREQIGIESIMWGSDFPHHVSTWPESKAVLDAQFQGVSDEDRKVITNTNANDLYGFS